ncbi:LDL receptor repeat-containing protein egg-1-like [Amphibalanus amphitrite]|uniref:LDL receptor repeat-containing protein egg-1-like n=1 Tax=Amphibalanus amphitrite TaxID=1232801 RepID=UPI001C90DFF0|nr:LDL receptor repeat-containing protein egg-1-like [Amphibalanus amphitrite]
MTASLSTSLVAPLLLLLVSDWQLPTAEGSYSSLSTSSNITHVGGEQFFCEGADRRPVPHNQICDGVNDCEGREDETNCHECKSTGWRCLTSHECVSALNKCDGVTHCPDGSDEDRRDCMLEPCHGKNRFKCANGICVNAEERCDCHPVCSDGSDEWNCGTERRSCRPHEFSCTLSGPPRLCLKRCNVCDGHMDCPHGEDEKICRECRHGAFHCRSDVCIEQFRRCNGVEDCDGGEDELDCPEEPRSPVSAGRRPRHPEAGGRAGAAGPAALLGAGLPPTLLTLLLLTLLTLR